MPSIALIFWIVYIVGLLLDVGLGYRAGTYAPGNLIFWVLIGLLGYKTFGG